MNKNNFEEQVWNSSMNQTAKTIALAVATHGDWATGKNIRPSEVRVASMASCTRDTARKYIAALVEQGWLKYIRTHKNNVREYELMEQVAEPIGILAKQKRRISAKQVSNLKNSSLTEDNQVADTVVNLNSTDIPEVADTVVNLNGVVNNQVADTNMHRLPKLSNQVADTIVTTLYDLTKNVICDTPSAGAPVVSPDIKEKEERFFLNRLEVKELNRMIELYGVDEADASLMKNLLETGRVKGVFPSFTKKVEAAMADIGLEVGEEW